MDLWLLLAYIKHNLARSVLTVEKNLESATTNIFSMIKTPLSLHVALCLIGSMHSFWHNWYIILNWLRKFLFIFESNTKPFYLGERMTEWSYTCSDFLHSALFRNTYSTSVSFTSINITSLTSVLIYPFILYCTLLILYKDVF